MTNREHRLPQDLEAEQSVLAELAQPLHHVAALGLITVDDFADHRHRRIFEQLADDVTVRADDQAYLDELVAHAFPLTMGLLTAFLDVARRRRRLLALERERLELLDGYG
jgi:hypothetical protein